MFYCLVIEEITERILVPMRLGETPVPIPNTTVKPQPADGTMLETAWESRWLPDSYGGVAQLGEHLPCKQGVKSSNLSVSTGSRNASESLVFSKINGIVP